MCKRLNINYNSKPNVRLNDNSNYVYIHTSTEKNSPMKDILYISKFNNRYSEYPDHSDYGCVELFVNTISKDELLRFNNVKRFKLYVKNYNCGYNVFERFKNLEFLTLYTNDYQKCDFVNMFKHCDTLKHLDIKYKSINDKIMFNKPKNLSSFVLNGVLIYV